MPRTMLTDKAWEALKQILKETGRVYNKYEHRNTLEGILYRMRTGIQWRDLPEKFGRWNSVSEFFKVVVRFSRFMLLPEPARFPAPDSD